MVKILRQREINFVLKIAIKGEGARLVVEARDDFWSDYMKGCEDIDGVDWARPLACASMGPYGAHLSDGSEYTGERLNEAFLSELPQLTLMVDKNKTCCAFLVFPPIFCKIFRNRFELQ